MSAEGRANISADRSPQAAEAGGQPIATGAVFNDGEASREMLPLTMLPLCVDLDGTLVKSDTLADSVCVLARTHPWDLLRLPGWLLGGKARFKREVSARAPLDAAHLPYNEALIVYLREQAASGRPLYLSTGADQHVADAVAQHLGLFDGVFSSDGATNLTGREKLRLLESRFGHGNFAYVGNSRKDLPLLTASKAAMLANPTAGLQSLLQRKKIPVQQVFQDRASGAQSVWRALRVHQWAKNVLIFLPLILAHALKMNMLLQSALAFLSFSLVASSTYIANDILDLAADRVHPRKRRRPFAAGDLSVIAGLCVAILLFAVGVAISIPMAPRFTFWLLVYCVRHACLFALFQARRDRRRHYFVRAVYATDPGWRSRSKSSYFRLDGGIFHLLLLQPGPGQALQRVGKSARARGCSQQWPRLPGARYGAAAGLRHRQRIRLHRGLHSLHQ